MTQAQKIERLLGDGVERYGMEIARETGIPWRGIYVTLGRMVKAGRLTSRTRNEEKNVYLSGSPRRYYRLVQ